MERKTKIALGIISTLLVGGGVWFFFLKKKRTFILSVIQTPNPDPKDGYIYLYLNDKKKGKLVPYNGDDMAVGSQIKINGADALLDGKYEVIGFKENVAFGMVKIKVDYDILSNGGKISKSGTTITKAFEKPRPTVTLIKK